MINRAELIKLTFILLLLVSCTQKVVSNKAVDKKILVYEDSVSYESYYNFTVSRMYLYDNDLAKSIEYMELAEIADPGSAYLKYNLAQLYISANLTEDAKAKLKEVIEIDEDNVESYKLLGRLMSTSSSEKDKKEAGKYLQKAVKIDPDNSDSYFLLALHYLQIGEKEKAKELLQKSIKLQPDDEDAYFFLGELLKEDENLESALALYSELLTLDPKNFATLLTLASIEEKMLNYIKAEQYFTQLLKYHPNNSKAYEQYGNYLYRTKRAEEATKQYQNAEILDLNNPEIKFKLGIIYLENKEPEKAIEKFDYILSTKSTNEAALYYKALALIELENYSDAGNILNSLSGSTEYFDKAIIQSAYILEKQDKYPEAKEHMEKAYADYPGNVNITNYLGAIYRKKENYKSAIELYNGFLSKNPNNEAILYSLAVTNFSAGKETESIKIMKDLLELNPDNADALNYIGYTYADKGVNLDEAESYIKKAMKLAPNTGYIIDSLGWVYYRKGMLNEAIVNLELAAKLSPEDAAIWDHLGDVYMESGDIPKALKSYEYALKLLNENEDKTKEDKKLEAKVRDKINGINVKLSP
jgi:tetratricopeptide (TPR) repeat protein